jgi:hypothetical protein
MSETPGTPDPNAGTPAEPPPSAPSYGSPPPASPPQAPPHHSPATNARAARHSSGRQPTAGSADHPRGQ